MEKELVKKLNETLDSNQASTTAERRLSPSDNKLVNEIISSLGDPDNRVITGAKLAKDNIVKRVKSLKVPQMINGEIQEVSLLSLKIENNQLVPRSQTEIEEYLAKTSGEQIITDIKLIAQKVNSTEEIVQYYKEHPTKKPKEDTTEAIRLDTVVESKLSVADQQKYANLDQYAHKAISEISNKEDNIKFLNSSLNLSTEEFKQKLSIFIKNFMITNLDQARTTQLEHGVSVDAGGTKEMHFVLGSAGAGKSSTIQDLKENRHAFHAEADDIKMQLAKSFGVDVNHPAMHKLSGTILKNVLIPQCVDLNINFILEKIGDEPHKIEALAKQYKERGYETNLSCIHVDVQECRIRNIMRSVGYMQEGKPPRMVEDEEVQKIGYNPLITYILLTQNSKDLFKTGECYINQNPQQINPQILSSLYHGPTKEFHKESYKAKAQVYTSHVIDSIFNKYLAKQQDISPEELQIISQFAESIKSGNATIPTVKSKHLLKHLCVLRAFSKSALNHAFNPQVIISPDPQNPFSIGLNEEFDVKDKKGNVTHFSSNMSRIEETINLITQKGSEAYITATTSADKMIAREIERLEGITTW